MAGEAQVHVALKIELDPESVAGVVRNGDSAETRFHGWLELLATSEEEER